jgi:holo-[acyl-carrier protein] synthase
VVIGVGTDILSMQRFGDLLGADGEAFVRRVFTAAERRQAALSPDEKAYLATRFAGKEAVFKCFGIHGNVRLGDIEVLDGETGQPYVTLFGSFVGMAREKGITEILISLSYENDYAIALAVAGGQRVAGDNV